MTKKILLDANMLIAVFDHQGTTDPEIKKAAKSRLTEVLNKNNDCAIFITPLIRYEVLRGVNWHCTSQFQNLQQALNSFPELDISTEIAELSANLFRFDKHQAGKNSQRNFDKRKLDIFHFCTAKCNGLELCSTDSDIGKIAKLYADYMQADAAGK